MSIFDYDPETGLPRSSQDWRDTQRNIAEAKQAGSYMIVDTDGFVYGIAFEVGSYALAVAQAADMGFWVTGSVVTQGDEVIMLIVEPRDKGAP